MFVTFLLDPTGPNPHVKHEWQRAVIRFVVVTTFLTRPLDDSENLSSYDRMTLFVLFLFCFLLVTPSPP
jgi:hypothetical protein